MLVRQAEVERLHLSEVHLLVDLSPEVFHDPVELEVPVDEADQVGQRRKRGHIGGNG